MAGYDPTILFGTNHIVNGNFELRIIPEGKSWDVYSQKRTPGWRVSSAEGLEGACPDGSAVEFQNKNTRVLASDQFNGDQFAELDSHCFSSQKRGADSRVKIFERVDTRAGKIYKLSFSAASRDNFGELKLEVKDHFSNSQILELFVTKDNQNEKLKLLNRKMQRYVIYFKASGTLTEISFEDTDKAKSTYGVLLDNVELYGMGVNFENVDYQAGENIKMKTENLESLKVEVVSDVPTTNIQFVSLGLSGTLEAKLTSPLESASDGNNPKLYVIETTFGDDSYNTKACGNYKETMTATVRLSDGSSQQLLDENGEENVCGDVSYSLSVTSDGASIDSIVLKDTTENKKYDGYDINYIGFSL